MMEFIGMEGAEDRGHHSLHSELTTDHATIGVWGGGGGGGGAAPPQNSGKQWVKFGQSKKKKSARESYKLTPLECWWWRHTGNVQGGGGLVNVQE